MKDKDKQLLLKAKKGNKQAFGKLVLKYQDKVLYLAYDLVGDYSSAQDIAQNAFLRAYKGLTDFKEKSSFSTWLYRIVVNLSIDYRRAQSRRRIVSIDEPTENADYKILNIIDNNEKQPDELIVLKNFADQVKSAVLKLPHNQRVAFTLRNFHDMDMTEIAKVLKCKTGTVRSHLFRAINKLQNELKEFKK